MNLEAGVSMAGSENRLFNRYNCLDDAVLSILFLFTFYEEKNLLKRETYKTKGKIQGSSSIS